MTVETALRMFWDYASRSSIREASALVPVSHSTASGWKKSQPTGATRRKLLEWAEREAQNAELPPTILVEAIQRTGANLAKLAEVKGMADAVLRMMQGITEQQQIVVDSLAPWSAAEGLVDASRQLAANVSPEHLSEIERSVRQSAASAAKPMPRAKKRGTGGR